MTPLAYAALFGAAAVGGAINSVAGGGSLVSFPLAVAFGMSPLVANATNSVAMTPASVAAAIGYREHVGREAANLRRMIWPSVIGTSVGAVLLLVTPARVFDLVVPVLVLSATGLLVWQTVRPPRAEERPPRPAVAMVLQGTLSVYGGYFGAGMGILMLATFGLLGIPNIHRMNALKTVLGAVINFLASLVFVFAGAIDYPAAGIMAVGATLGGYVGSRLAQKVPTAVVRWIVVAVGVALSVVFVRRAFG